MPYVSSGPSGSFSGIVTKDVDNSSLWSMSPSYKGYETTFSRSSTPCVHNGKFKPVNGKKIAMIWSDNPYSKAISEGMKNALGGGLESDG